MSTDEDSVPRLIGGRLDELMTDLKEEIHRMPEGLRSSFRLVFYIMEELRHDRERMYE